MAQMKRLVHVGGAAGCALMSGSYRFSCSILEGFCKYGVGIVVIYDEDVLVA